jgi:hypothetical protein
MLLAIANGSLRELLLSPRLGERMAHWLSTLLLCLLVLLVAFLLTPWIGARQPSDTWKIGALWLALTLGFEFLAGHYVFRNSWQKLLADYDLLAGRVWVFVPIVTLVAPRLALAVHGS